MPTVDRFEDLSIWQKARSQACRVYGVVRESPALTADFGLGDQLQRAAVSVMNNIAEGFERSTDADFARFLDNAKGSNGEVRSMLHLLEDLGFIEEEPAASMRAEAEALSRAIGALLNHLRKR